MYSKRAMRLRLDCCLGDAWSTHARQGCVDESISVLIRRVAFLLAVQGEGHDPG